MISFSQFLADLSNPALAFLPKALLVAVLVPLLAGCGTLRYYTQAVSGQIDLLRRAAPIDEQLRAEML